MTSYKYHLTFLTKNSINTRIAYIQTQLLETRFGRLICVVLAILFLSVYLFLFFDFPTIVHPEFLPSRNNDFLGFIVPAHNFISLIPEKVFNLKIVEYGHYRPRMLGFFFQYIDTNITVRWFGYTPGCGIKQPGIILSMILMMYAVAKMSRRFLHITKEYAILLGVLSLYIINFQTGIFLALRSAKMITAPVCLLLFLHYTKYINIKMRDINTKTFIKYSLQSIFTFLLCTLDEQVLACVFFLLILGVIFSLHSKQINTTFLICGTAILIYLSFHLLWGKLIFLYYTGVLSPHPHRISDIFFKFKIMEINNASAILLCALSTIVWIGIILPITHVLLAISAKKQTNILILSLLSTGFSILLVTALIITHPSIFRYHDLWFSYYILPALLIYIFSFFSLSSKSSMPFCKLLPVIFLSLLIINACHNIYYAPDIYKNFLSTNNGHLGTLSYLTFHKGTREPEIIPISTEEFLKKYKDVENANNIFQYIITPRSGS